jgi:hypothetical protein
VSEAPDSSKNTMQTCRLRALCRILGPALGHPAGDLLVVAFDGAAGGMLRGPAQLAQQAPDVAGVVGDAGLLLDHLGHAGQGPLVGVVAVRAGAGQQGFGPACLPASVPDQSGLTGDAQGAGDLGLGGAVGEQVSGPKPALSHGGEVAWVRRWLS